MNDKFIIKDGEIVSEPDLMKWGKWMSSSEKHLYKDELNGSFVSTIFLGLDHNYLGSGPPVLFETMIFSGIFDGYQKRCSTFKEAKLEHQKALNLLIT